MWALGESRQMPLPHNLKHAHDRSQRTHVRSSPCPRSLQDVAEQSLVITALWALGEFGEMLLPGAGGPLLEGEPPLTVSDLDVAVLVEGVARRAARTDPVIR